MYKFLDNVNAKDERNDLMEISIREYIKNNFKESDVNEIKEAINGNIDAKEELALPGMGVFFEIIWQNCDNNMQEEMIKLLKNNI